jgi:F0F1-type ATP synthase assembly protein I
MTKYFKIDKSFDLKKVDKIEFEKKLVKNISKKSFLDKNPLEKYLDIGYYLLIPIIIFLLIGIYFDKFFKTKPFGVIFFLFLGVFSSFYNLYRLTKEK